jgi:Ca2+-binding EF-hand superfamily protein
MCYHVSYSLDDRLIETETPRQKAKQIFETFDDAGNGFIPVRLRA